MWRAIESSAIQNIAYIGIVALESVAAIVLIAASVVLVGAMRAGSGGYGAARRLSTVGLLMVVVLLFGGFIVVGDEWFRSGGRRIGTGWTGLPELGAGVVRTAAGSSAVAGVGAVDRQAPAASPTHPGNITNRPGAV